MGPKKTAKELELRLESIVIENLNESSRFSEFDFDFGKTTFDGWTLRNFACLLSLSLSHFGASTDP